jgi:hypothetical protein
MDVVSHQRWGIREELLRTRILRTIRRHLRIGTRLAYRTRWVFFEVTYVKPDGCQVNTLPCVTKGATFAGDRRDHILPYLSTLRIGPYASGSREFHTRHLPQHTIRDHYGGLRVHTH